MARKVLINLATGLEDPERVAVAFLVGGAAVQRGETAAMWLTKEAVRLALPGHAQGVACEGCPPLPRLVEQFADGGGELLVCPICWSARRLEESAMVANARLVGATRCSIGSETTMQQSSAIDSTVTAEAAGSDPSGKTLGRKFAEALGRKDFDTVMTLLDPMIDFEG